LYSDLIHAALSDAARKALQMIPEGYQFQTRLIRESIEKGREEGLKVGREEGLKEGLKEGLREGLREGLKEGLKERLKEGRALGQAMSVTMVFEAREIAVSEDTRAKILACSDLHTLTQWLKRSITVASADEVFTQ
jgi:flagellar biosynthesis/type III secretory pathway protein FliH